MARTTLDIDEELLQNARVASGRASKKAVVEEALRELIRARARQELLDHIRSGEPMGGMTPEELLAWRRSGLKRIRPMDQD